MTSQDQPQSMQDLSAWELRGTLFLTALCTLLVEILLTRILSVVMWYHFTFAVISISMLGIAAGAMYFYRWYPREVEANTFYRAASNGLQLFSIAVTLPIILMTFLVATPTFSSLGVLLLLVYFAACMLPFYASGFVTAVIFRCGANRVSALYAIDLIAAAAGCLLSIPLLNRLGGTGSLLGVSVLLSAAASVVAARGKVRRQLPLALVTTVVFLGILIMQMAYARVDLRTVKLGPREELRPIFAVKWNSHSRLAVLDYYNPQEHNSPPFLSWGLSDQYTGALPRQYLITIDGASETPITELRGDIHEHEYLAWDITSLPYHLRPGAKTLIIGAGGGRDLLTALWFGSHDITGVELNQGIVDWVKGRYAEFAGDLYSRPEIHIVVDDGRNFTRSSPNHYDILQISMIDTFAATAAGAYTLSENNLYTVEAFVDYLDHLTPDGILSMNRFFLEPPQQTLRIVTVAREALARRGISDPAKHIVVVRTDSPLGNNGLVMIKASPFTGEEIAKLQELWTSRKFVPIAVPGLDLSNPFTAYLQDPTPERFYQSYPFNVRPSTDDQPFFFNTFKVATFKESLQLRQKIEAIRLYNYDAVFILFVLLALAVVSLLLFLFVPLLRGSQDAAQPVRLPGGQLAYFVWVGLGFILVEVVLIQRFHLYLGHPIYSLAVTLVSLLAFSGLGSAWTSQWGEVSLSRRAAAACGAVFVAVLVLEGVWLLFQNQTMGLPLAVRIALVVVALLPIGVLMGMPYPLGLRVVSEQNPNGLPWVWAVNGAASVLGSILAFALAMVVGFRMVFLFGGACYLIALLCALVSLRSETASVARA